MIFEEAASVRPIIGLAGQYPAVDENLTGKENLEMIGRLYHMGKEKSRTRAGELLETFELADAGNRRVKTYSGGMRRRLDLAAALVAEPTIFFWMNLRPALIPAAGWVYGMKSVN